METPTPLVRMSLSKYKYEKEKEHVQSRGGLHDFVRNGVQIATGTGTGTGLRFIWYIWVYGRAWDWVGCGYAPKNLQARCLSHLITVFNKCPSGFARLSAPPDPLFLFFKSSSQPPFRALFASRFTLGEIRK